MKQIEPIYLINDIEQNFNNKGMCCVEIDCYTQQEVKESLIYESGFPMLTNEYTNESPYEVDIDTSKFLNDEYYDTYWFRISNGVTIVYVCIKPIGEDLEISAIETNNSYRNMGFGGTVIGGIELFALSNGFNSIVVSAFDSESERFWENNYYEKDELSGKMIKKSI